MDIICAAVMFININKVTPHGLCIGDAANDIVWHDFSSNREAAPNIPYHIVMSCSVAMLGRCRTPAVGSFIDTRSGMGVSHLYYSELFDLIARKTSTVRIKESNP